MFEDLVFLCRTMGHETGIDLDRLSVARAILARAMPDEPLYGAIVRAAVPIGHQQM